MPRNKYPEETVKLILDTATRLFTEKGFEKTSLQDIMNETKLSKGAIYHHFASKEDIFIKICANTSKRTEQLLSKVRDDKRLNGREKLKKIYAEALGNTVNNEIVPMQPYMISNHKFLAAQVESLMREVAPDYIQPILEQGIADKTLHGIEHPRQTAEMLSLLSSLWLNPLLLPSSDEEIIARGEVVMSVLNRIGADFTAEELIRPYLSYNRMLQK